MTTFSEIWYNDIKPLAIACVVEPELVRLMSQSEDYEPSEEEKEYLLSSFEKYKDPYGMFSISNMIRIVEHDLADGRIVAAILTIAEVYEVLNRPSYFQNVFISYENDEEWKTRVALRDELSKQLMYGMYF